MPLHLAHLQLVADSDQAGLDLLRDERWRERGVRLEHCADRAADELAALVCLAIARAAQRSRSQDASALCPVVAQVEPAYGERQNENEPERHV